MIVRLRGILVGTTATSAVVECGGVGYELLMPAASVLELPAEGEEIVVHTRQIFREDDQLLVGFTKLMDRRVFDLLTEVKGCGPKVSLQVLSDLGASETLSAISAEDAKRLAKASGVGPRLAERIIVELKEKVRHESLGIHFEATGSPPHSKAPSDSELVEALLALGYRRPEAERASLSAPDTSEDIAERLKRALQVLKR